VLLFPDFKLFWGWCIDCCLHCFDLLSTKAIIVKDLPFLGGSLVWVDFTFYYLIFTDKFFGHIFRFNKHLPHSWAALKATPASVSPSNMGLIVIIIIVANTWALVMEFP